ncbi:MAG: hypothetical protein F6J98_27860 [Moorea sp. SIO4G2]|nr:hypothetical protein [Moorena sp. SIO4G2]
MANITISDLAISHVYESFINDLTDNELNFTHGGGITITVTNKKGEKVEIKL